MQQGGIFALTLQLPLLQAVKTNLTANLVRDTIIYINPIPPTVELVKFLNKALAC